MAPDARIARAGGGVELIDAAQPTHEVAEPATPDLHLDLYLEGSPRVWRDGLPPAGTRLAPGAMLLTPEGTAARWRIEGRHRPLMVCVPAAEAGRLLADALPGGDPLGASRRLCGAPFRDPQLDALCRAAWREAARGDAVGALFGQHAAVAILARLVRLGSGGRWPPSARDGGGPGSQARGALPPWRLRRVLELVEANLNRQVGLAELAAAAGLSTPHFARAFRAVLGEPPYRYALRRRLERARALLRDTDLPVAEIALEVGFAHQQHFAGAFRRDTGVAPAAWRAAARAA